MLDLIHTALQEAEYHATSAEIWMDCSTPEAFNSYEEDIQAMLSYLEYANLLYTREI